MKNIIVIVLLAMACNSPQSHDQINTTMTIEMWDKLSYEEQEQWILDECKKSNEQNREISVSMLRAVKSQFQFPGEIDFSYGETPLLERAYVTLADEGVAFVIGSGTAKNAFGAKGKFRYQIRLTMLPNNRKIEEVKVYNQ